VNFTDQSCKMFAENLASKAPVPGGGGASALVGALGSALGSMVGQLTVGKKKYAEVESDILCLMKQAKDLQDQLLELVEKDAQVFAPLAEAYGMPKDTEEEKKQKEIVMEAALNHACSIPLEIMEKSCRVIELQKEFAAKGSALAISDAGVGVIFAKAALQGASLNVFINTASMKDRQRAELLNRRAEELLEEYTAIADRIFNQVCGRLSASERKEL